MGCDQSNLVVRILYFYWLLPEQDGPTDVALGDMTEVDPGYEPAFEGQLENA
jgi:hypothetical protein